MTHALLRSIIFGIAFFGSLRAFSQTGSFAINTDGSNADPSALLDVKSTNQGMLVPRMNESQRNAIASPAQGLLVYQTDATPGFYFYNGTVWTSLNGANGTNGTNGQGVPTGGTAGQVLAKVDATNYNTEWVTPGSGSASIFPNVELNISNNTSQSITNLVNGTSANLIAFSGSNSNATLTGGNAWNGTTFTVGSTGTGWYQVNVQIVGTANDGVTSNNIGIPFYMDINGAVGNTMSSAIKYRSNYSSLTSTSHLKNNNTLSILIYLSTGNTLTFYGISASNSTAANTSSNGSTYLNIVRVK